MQTARLNCPKNSCGQPILLAMPVVWCFSRMCGGKLHQNAEAVGGRKLQNGGLVLM